MFLRCVGWLVSVSVTQCESCVGLEYCSALFDWYTLCGFLRVYHDWFQYEDGMADMAGWEQVRGDAGCQGPAQLDHLQCIETWSPKAISLWTQPPTCLSKLLILKVAALLLDLRSWEEGMSPPFAHMCITANNGRRIHLADIFFENNSVELSTPHGTTHQHVSAPRCSWLRGS